MGLRTFDPLPNAAMAGTLCAALLFFIITYHDDKSFLKQRFNLSGQLMIVCKQTLKLLAFYSFISKSRICCLKYADLCLEYEK